MTNYPPFIHTILFPHAHSKSIYDNFMENHLLLSSYYIMCKKSLCVTQFHTSHHSFCSISNDHPFSSIMQILQRYKQELKQRGVMTYDHTMPIRYSFQYTPQYPTNSYTVCQYQHQQLCCVSTEPYLPLHSPTPYHISKVPVLNPWI